jgi:L-ascorbate metabolism protein UlaG (beta-lactamase superfamily)
MSQLPDKEIPLIVRPRPDKKIPFIVRSGDIAADARRLGYTDVRELPPWQETQVKALTITAVPAVHPGTEVGFVIQGEKTVYFAGDTALDHGIFTDIDQRFDLDVVLLPIGGLRIFGRGRAIDPVQAVEALKLLHPKVVVGIHWGGLPHWLPFVKLPGTPSKLVDEVTKAQINVRVLDAPPLHTVVV